MKIVVLGAGTVGTSIAEMLCRQRHAVTIVDEDIDNVRRINESLDVRALHGSASHATVLFQAGVLDADLCLAVTGNDEVNLVSASVARSMGARRTVARVFAPIFRDLSTFDYQRHFQIDRLLSLEHLSAMEFARHIRHAGAAAVEHFLHGSLEVQEFVVQPKTRSAGAVLRELRLPKGVRIGSIYRGGVAEIARADSKLDPGDRVTLVGAREDIEDVRDWFQRDDSRKTRVIIAGGGETGFNLARSLDVRRCSVMLMDRDRARCEFLSRHLRHATVVHCDATQRATLEEERVDNADFFVACFGDDEDNIITGVEAREIGADKVMAIVNRPDYGSIVGKLGIDHVVSPRAVMARQVLGFLNVGPVISSWAMGAGNLRMLEIEVLPGVAATDHVLANLHLPAECLIAAVMRRDYAKVPGADDRLLPGDTVVALASDQAVEPMLRLFRDGSRM